MKATGYVRHFDDLGRIVIPKEVRKKVKIQDFSAMEIFVNDKNEIILKKYNSDVDTVM